MTVQVTSNHTQETPLDLATIRPPVENDHTTVQIISVDPSVVDGSVLIKSGASVYGVPQSEFIGPKGEQGDTGDTGPAPATSWIGTSLIVGDNPPVDLQGPEGERGPIGSPGAVATASDFLLVGPGRPDTPATTGGIITGSEPVGCEYRSTDGAAVGAWVWMNRPTGWEVTDGDTGWRRIDTPGVVRGFVALRRTHTNLLISIRNNANFGLVTMKSNTAFTDQRYYWALRQRGTDGLPGYPAGFSPASTEYPLSLVTLDGNQVLGSLYAGEGNLSVRVPVKNADYSDLRLQEIATYSAQAWPTTLPGSPT